MSIFPEHLTELKEPIMISRHSSLTYYKLHRHNFLEFLYVVDGEGEEYINDEKYELVPGTFSLVLPYQLHMLKSSEVNPMKFFSVAASLETIFHGFNSGEEMKDILIYQNDTIPSSVRFQGEDFQKLHTRLNDMLDEYTRKDKWWMLSLKAKLLDILIAFNRLRSNCQRDIPNHNISSSSHKIFWDIIYYLYTNYSEHITLSDLSAKFNLSPNYISTSFSKIFSENYLDFLSDMRIRHACSMLISTEMKITDIAIAVGYESYRSFVRVFEEKMGVTPSNYRKRTFTH